MTRSIDPKMFAYLDGKAMNDADATDAIKRRDPRGLFTRIAQLCEGIREVGGNNEGPLVEMIQKTLGSADREPWCMSFVQTCLAYVEQKLGVISPIAASEHCLTVWNNTPEKQRVQTIPATGAIVIWQHKGTSAGHTGITTSPVKNNVVCCAEGNTEAGMVSGKVERDGGGVYATIRSIKGSGSMRIVGFLKPFAA